MQKRKTKIHELTESGQSIWLDNINRNLIDTGRLGDMILKGLRGLTSNPTIFEKALLNSISYEQKIIDLFNLGKDIFEIYDDITVKDIQDAADVFMGVYEKTNGMDGFVSLEVNPRLSHDTQETIQEARRLFTKVARPNLLLKIPATQAGLKAAEVLLGEGINVNFTLIFSLSQYEDSAKAFLRGLKRCSKPDSISSVASVFVSRVDTVVDSMLDERTRQGESLDLKSRLESLKGKAAVSNSMLIYNKFIEIFSSNEFKELKNKGARIQRLLWGSTSTKNPKYSDIKYVTELIAKDTINTIPEVTFDAFLDHGEIRQILKEDLPRAKEVLDSLKNLGVDVNKICNKLLDEGLNSFERSFNQLLCSIEDKTKVVSYQ